MGSEIQPGPEQVIDLLLAAAHKGIQKVVAATVVTFVPAPAPGQLAEASVQPMVMDRRRSGKVEAKPQIPHLPVLFPGGGGWRIEWGLSPGDPVLVVCADEDIHAWLTAMAVPAPPQTGRRHDFSDGLVLPLFGPQSTVAGVPSDLSITGPGGLALLVEGATGIVHLGGESAVLGVARITDTIAADTAMAIWMTAAQTVLAGAAALLALPVPVFPSDFGVVSSASAKVVSE